MAFFTGESSCNECPNDLQRKLDSRNARGETEHVAIVVFARLVRGIGITAKRRADAAQLIRSHSRTDTAAADQNPDIRGAALHGFTNQFCVIRIIVRNGGVVSAKIRDLVSGQPQFINHSLVEWYPCMICSNRYPHNLVTTTRARASKRSQY